MNDYYLYIDFVSVDNEILCHIYRNEAYYKATNSKLSFLSETNLFFLMMSVPL